MAKSIKKNDSVRCDFRIPQELLSLFMETFHLEPKELPAKIHDVIDDAILRGLTYSNRYEWCNQNLTKRKVSQKDFLHPKRYQHPYERQYIQKNSSYTKFADDQSIIYDKTVKIDFRESMTKINFLSFYYRTYKDYYAYIDSINSLEEKTVYKKKTNEYVKQSIKGKFIRYAIYDAIYKRYDESPISSSDSLVPYPGQKNASMCAWITNIFDELTKQESNIEYYAEPFMGSANMFLHYSNAPASKNCFLNDLDYDMVSLVKTIRDNLLEFKLKYMQYEYSRETFDNAQSNYFKSHEKKLTSSPLDCALNIFILLHFSHYSDKISYIDVPQGNRSDIRYFWYLKELWSNKMIPLYRISQRLKNVNISCSDAFYFIKKHNQKNNVLFYIDSPYFYSEDVYNDKSDKSDIDENKIFPHKKLARALIKIHNANNFFVASNRVTISDTRKKNHNWTNDLAIDMANKCYAKKGFYYELRRFKDMTDEEKTQVEIVVTNFAFPNGTPFFNKENDTINLITTKMVDACISSETS